MSSLANLTQPQQAATTMATSAGDGAASPDTSVDWFDMPKMDNFIDAFSFCCSGAVILGGLVPYIPQYLTIKKMGSSDGFSTYVCLTLLLANILRIAFWFGHRFELPLLFQSFVMTVGMLAMMELCIRVRGHNVPYIIGPRPSATRSRQSIIVPPSETSSPPSESARSLLASRESHSPSQETSYHKQECIDTERADDLVTHIESLTQYNSNSNSNSFSDLEPPILTNILEPTRDQEVQQQTNGAESQPADHSYSNGYKSNQRKHRLAIVKWLYSSNFWNWDDLLSYVKFLTLFTVILGLITYLFIDNHMYVETLGFVAVFTESMLGMPQLLRNYAKKSTRGMSVEMVVMWLSGDLFKTLYFVLRQQPVQFIVCGAIQVSLDILILIQVFWYKRSRVTYNKLPKST